MIEIKVTVEIPGVAEAINNLAQAIAEKKPVSLETVKREAPAVQVSAPVVPATPVEAPAKPSAPVQLPVQSVPAPAPATPPEAPAAPVSAQQQALVAAKPVTMNDLSLAGAKLVDAGKMDAVINALKNFGAVAITQLREDQYASFAECLRSLGADI